ncbi:MAG: PAS domain S-box protein [Halovenus sp.]
MKPTRVLCVGAGPDPGGEGFVVDRVPTATAARAVIADGAVDCVVSAYDLPEEDGLTLLEQVRDRFPDRTLPFVLWVEAGSEQVAATALNAGATSYVRAGDERVSLEERIEHDLDAARQTREGEQFRGSVGVLRDVTDRKERERELRRYEAFVENTSDAIAILDADGTIEYVSPASEAVFGYEPETLVGRDVRDFIHPEDVERVTEEAGALLGEPAETTVQEWRVERPNGSWVWIESTIVNGTGESSIDGLLVVSRSIDEHEEYEKRLEEQRDDLAVLNEILRHDVRNDLQMIFSYTDLLGGAIESEEATAHLEKIEESAKNAVDLIETLQSTYDSATVTVAVADNGPGIPEGATESIFGKGEKGLESAGTGMGLYLVRTLVERYGGEVTVADNDPRGAVFTVALPVAE